MVVLVPFASVFLVEVLVGEVGVTLPSMAVLVDVLRAQMVKPPRHPVVIVGQVVVLVRMHQLLVVVFIPRMTGGVRHLGLLSLSMIGRTYTPEGDAHFLIAELEAGGRHRIPGPACGRYVRGTSRGVEYRTGGINGFPVVVCDRSGYEQRLGRCS